LARGVGEEPGEPPFHSSPQIVCSALAVAVAHAHCQGGTQAERVCPQGHPLHGPSCCAPTDAVIAAGHAVGFARPCRRGNAAGAPAAPATDATTKARRLSAAAKTHTPSGTGRLGGGKPPSHGFRLTPDERRPVATSSVCADATTAAAAAAGHAVGFARPCRRENVAGAPAALATDATTKAHRLSAAAPSGTGRFGGGKPPSHGFRLAPDERRPVPTSSVFADATTAAAAEPHGSYGAH
jgi:hypothetical protein